MKFVLLALALFAPACAASAPAPSKPIARPSSAEPPKRDRPVLEATPVHGPFKDIAELCKEAYGFAKCLDRTKDRVAGKSTVSTTEGPLRSVEVVALHSGEFACAIVFDVSGRLYVHRRPAFCRHQGHTLLIPTIRELSFRDLDGRNQFDIAIVADADAIYDAPEGVEPDPNAKNARNTMAVFCGQNAGATPSFKQRRTIRKRSLPSMHFASTERGIGLIEKREASNEAIP